MPPHSQFLYRLLHDRDFRRRFIAGEHAALDIPPEVLEDASTINLEDLERTAQKVALTVRGVIHQNYPSFFERWKQATPADPHGFEIVFHFVASREYLEASNFDTTGEDTTIPNAFSKYIDRIALKTD